MKKYVWIGIVGFLLGIIVSGYVFLYLPEREGLKNSNFETAGASLNTSLHAAPSRYAPEAQANLDFVAIADKVGPAVVMIVSERVDKVKGFGFEDRMPFDDFWEKFFGRPQERQREQEYRSQAQGSGFLLSEDGYILTNYHIVENAVDLVVTVLSGEEYKAKVVGTDPRTDLALLKVDAKGLPFAVLGDSAQLKVGEWVLAIGNPFGLEHSVTSGIVSAKGRQLGLGGNVPEYQDFIQTDAAINRGNSGGPLVNVRGEVVGITSNIFSPSGGSIGLGFAIPSNMAKKVVTQLKEKGRVIRGRIGVIIKSTSLTEDDKDAFKLKDRNGALLVAVEKGSPAEKAGLKQYDVISEVNGERVKDSNDLKLKISNIEPGKKVELKVVRDGKELTFTVTVEELDPEEAKVEAKASDKDLGFTVRELTPTLARRYGLETQEGLIITQVRRYSEADRKGLAAADIILEVNRRKVATVDDLERMMAQFESGQAIILLVRREQDGESIDRIVTLRVP
jgi:serine protease Do